MVSALQVVSNERCSAWISRQSSVAVGKSCYARRTRGGFVARVLVVLNDRALAATLARLLEDRHHEVVLVHSCRDADRLHESFDVGVFAVALSDGSGVHLAARLSGFGRVHARIFFTDDRPSPALSRAAALGPVLRLGTPVDFVLDTVEAAVAHVVDEWECRTRVRPVAPDGDSSAPLSSPRRLVGMRHR